MTYNTKVGAIAKGGSTIELKITRLHQQIKETMQNNEEKVAEADTAESLEKNLEQELRVKELVTKA